MSEYGFTKLIELFEAIPETVDITEDMDGERLLQLTEAERLKVSCPIFSLVKTFLNREERFANKDVKYHLITAGNQNILCSMPLPLRLKISPTSNCYIVRWSENRLLIC